MQNLELYYMCLFLFIFRTAAVPMNASRSLHGDGKDTNHKTGSSKLTNKPIVSTGPTSIITYLSINHLERMAYEVFLGGSCNPTTWRSDIAIPTLQNLGITYYNPVGCSLSSSSSPSHTRYHNWILYHSKCRNGVQS